MQPTRAFVHMRSNCKMEMERKNGSCISSWTRTHEFIHQSIQGKSGPQSRSFTGFAYLFGLARPHNDSMSLPVGADSRDASIVPHAWMRYRSWCYVRSWNRSSRSVQKSPWRIESSLDWTRRVKIGDPRLAPKEGKKEGNVFAPGIHHFYLLVIPHRGKYFGIVRGEAARSFEPSTM